MKLFELYEARKNRFKPGTIWRDVQGRCVVKAFKIIDNHDLSKYKETLLHLDEGSDYGYSGKKECLEVVESSSKYGGLRKGSVISWYQTYIENYYVPSLDK